MELQNKRTRNVSRILLENDHVRTKSRGRSVRLRGRKPSTKATKALQYPKQKIKNLLKPIFSSRISNLDKLYPISTDKSSEHISAQFNQKTNEKENDDNMSSSSSSSNFNDAALDSEQDHFNNMIALSTENSALHRRYEREHADRLLKSFESGHDTTSKSDYDRPFWPNNAVSSDYGKDISPWIDLIMPGYSQPYCTRINIISRDEKHCSDGCPLSYSFGVDKFDQKLLYITPNQMYLITENIMSQIMKADNDIPIVIDWLEVSRASKLSKNVCKEFWWSFDREHIKDNCDGCIIPINCQHYYKVDETYYTELKNRVRQLLHFARESKEEQDKIL